MERKINFFDISLRNEYLKKISNTTFDVIVVGGGVTGAGICLDSSSRGLNTCLIEMNDFASGTSSKSTKLIHGGLRYLEQFKLKLVHETGTERAVLHKIAPHIIKSEKMLLPIIRGGKLNRFTTKAALFIYDLLANVKRVDRFKILSKAETQYQEPLLKKNKLLSSAIYSEYRTDDSRLTIDLIKKSFSYGASPINYVKAIKFIYDNEHKVIGVTCKDQFTNNSIDIYSKYIVNASGSWTDEVLESKNKKLVLSKGIHIVLPKEKLNIKQSIYFDALDSRMIFAIPRGKTVYVGTTDNKYEPGINNIRVSKREVKYLIDSINNCFTKFLDFKDVISSWSGLRPLVNDGKKNTREISRKDEIFISKDGLISIAGGKLTGYRKMAERVVNILVRKYKKKIKSKTKNILLFDHDFEFCKTKSYEYGISNSTFNKYYNIYGDNCLEIFKIFKKEVNSTNSEDKIIIAEFIFSRRNEMCQSLLDFFSQRNSVVYFDIERINDYLKILEKYVIEKNIMSAKNWDKELNDLNNYVKEITIFI